MPTAVDPTITSSPEEATDHTTIGDDTSCCSDVSIDLISEDEAFCQRLASYLYRNRHDLSVDDEVLDDCRRIKHRLPLVVVPEELHYGITRLREVLSAEVVETNLDRFLDEAGGEDRLEEVKRILDQIDGKVEYGSLSQDEENKASNISTLIQEVGGDLVAALAKPTEQQLTTLRNRKDDLSWRMKALLCNFDDGKDIAFWFGVTHFKLVSYMCNYFLGVYRNVYDKARVVMAWNKLKKAEQKTIRAVIHLAAKLNEIIHREIVKEDKELAKKPRKRRKKTKTTATAAAAVEVASETAAAAAVQEGGGRKIEFPSKIIDSTVRASDVACNKARQKDRTRYASPKKASHLNSKQAREAGEIMQTQFFKSANATNPKHQPKDEKWAECNHLLLKVDATGSPPRAGYGQPNRNIIVGDPNAVHTHVCASIGHGGEKALRDMVARMLGTGKFDTEIAEYMENKGISSNVTFTMVTSLGEAEEVWRKDKEKRKRAEKQRSTEEVDNDADIGATVTETDDFD